MTDEEKLKDLGLSEEDIDYMREQGAKIAMEFDVKAAREMAMRYFSLGLDDKGIELLDAASINANFWSTAIYEVTGRDIIYNEAANRFIDADTGQFVSNPYIDIRVDQQELDDYLNYLYS